MTNTDSAAQAALSAVLSDADARECRSCGERAAVRVALNASAAEPALAAHAVWFCFECGHEERAIE
jgi:hypothetical protein